MRSGFETCEPKKLASLISDSEVLPASGLSEEAGTTIGRYKLLQLIGEGGFGSVFMAEQETPVVRKVALKIIKLGMDTKQVIARFEAERQALAMMDHTNIAKVFDAGATDAGRPYFVMELVKGIPITDYCDQQKFSLRQRLELFIPVCKAVQHAHQKGIIHRDLKPSNVLVTLHDGIPIPKVIDFGIAKATNARLTEHTLFTEYRQFIGTPEYISPEQADISALDVDTRSDVYSLGVLLYQLLTGTTPFESKQLRNIAYAEIQRIIREVEPPKPSTRLSTIATSHDTRTVQAAAAEPKRLSRLVAGELDWIVMKCLEKDRTRRYDTAVALADDIQRHLSGDAVEASPPSKMYRLRKLVRKHGIALAVAIVLIATTAVSSWQAVSATRARATALRAKQRADLESTMTQAVNDFLNDDILSQASGFGQLMSPPDKDLKVRDALDQAADRIVGRFKDQPLIKAKILQTIGEAYEKLGEYDKARKHLREALDLGREFGGEDDRITLKCYRDLARTFQFQKAFDMAEPLYVAALTGQRRALGEHDPDTIATKLDLGYLYSNTGQYDKSQPLLEESLAENRTTVGEKHRKTLGSMILLGDLYRLRGDYARAEPLLLQVVEASRQSLVENSTVTLLAVHYLARLYMSRRDYSRAEPLLTEVIDGRRKVLGERAHDTLVAMADLAETYKLQGLTAKANAILQQERELSIAGERPTRPLPLSPGTADHFQLAPGELSAAKPILTDQFGNIYVAGHSVDGTGKAHGIVREKLGGSTTWVTVIDFAPEQATAFNGSATDQAANLYLLGNTGSPLHPRWVVLQRPPGGGLIEIDSSPEVANGYAAGAAVDADGNLFVVGNARLTNIPLPSLSPAKSIPAQNDAPRTWVVRKRAKGETAFQTVDRLVHDGGVADAEGVIAVPRGPAAGVYVFGFGGNRAPGGLWSSWLVRKSTDGGATWKLVEDFRYGPDSSNQAIAAAADARGNIYVVGSAAKPVSEKNADHTSWESHWVVRKSSDGGAIWTTVDDYQLSTGTDRMQNCANGLVIDPQGTVFVAGTGIDSKGFAHSIVRGYSGRQWVTVEDYLPGPGSRAVGRGCSLDSEGNLYVTVMPSWDKTRMRDWIVRLIPQSTISQRMGELPSTRASDQKSVPGADQ